MANDENLSIIRDTKTAKERGALGGKAKKGSKHINHWIQKLLQDEEFSAKLRIGFEVQDFKGAPLEAMIKAQMIKAVEGDTRAFDTLARHGWPQKTETDLNVKELPKPLLDGVNGLPSNDSNEKDTGAEQKS